MSGLFGGGKGAQTQQPVAASGIRVQTSVAGRAVPVVYGVNRVAGNIIWYGNFISTPHTSQGSAGGKGGGGGNNTTTSYTYTVGFIMALCEGTVPGLGRVWQNSDIYTQSQLGLTFFNGAYPQSPSGWMSANYPSQALGYTGIAYIMHSNFDLGSSTSLPNLSVEVYGLLKQDTSNTQGVRPDLIFNDLLTNTTYGLSWPPQWLGNYSGWANYCGALGIWFSPVFDTQTQVNQSLQDMLDSSNANCFWSEGVLKIVSYGDSVQTGNGYTFTPNVTPVYDLTDDDFIYQEGQDPIQVTRTSPQDAYNVVQVECVVAGNAYETYIAEAKDQYAIATFGPQVDTVRSYHHITDPALAQVVAQTILQRDVYIRNNFAFKLGWKYCALEPMDLVTLTDSRMGMNKYAVRITQIEEDDDGTLSFEAEEFPSGVATPATYQAQTPVAGGMAYNAPAPNVSNIGLYEPPAEYTNNQLVLWIAAGGIGNWGGCEVWVSVDNETFVRDGVIQGGSRVGILTAPLPQGNDPDTLNTLSVQLANDLNNTLAGGTQADADNFRTLCVVGQELISYQNAVLTQTNFYDLTYLRRGAYGTQMAAHAVDEQFFRVDNSVLSYPFMSALIGKPIYLKFVSFNPFGGGRQTLDSVPTFTYTIQGSANNYALPNVTNLYTNFVSGITQMFWSPVTDFRSFDYEVRVGATWGSATFLGRTTKPTFATSGDGTYWVAAHFLNPNGIDIYSAEPAELVVAGSVLLQNVIATFDEVATGWPGPLNITDTVNISGTPQIFRQDWQGTQLLYATPRTNNVLQSQNFSTVWGRSGGGTGSAPVVTSDYAAAPDGTITADRIVYSRGAGTSSSDFSRINQSQTTVAGQTYAQGLWLCSTDGVSTYQLQLSFSGISPRIITITPAWTYFENTAVAPDTVRGFRLDTIANSGSASADVLAWGAMQVQGSATGAYIPTTTAAVTVTDYTLAPDGVVTFASEPISGAILTWTGTGTGASTGTPINASDLYFGVGNGMTTVYQISVTFGGATITSSELTLAGSGNILTVANVLAMTDVLNFGGVASSGSYAFPTNRLLHSQDFTQSAWTKTNATISAATVTDPLGTNTAQKIARTASGDTNVKQSISDTSASTAFTGSVWLQAPSTTNMGSMVLRLRDGAGANEIHTTVTPIAGVWNRYSVSGSFPAGATAGVQFLIDSASTGGSAGDYMNVWGAQVNLGLTADGYTETTSAAISHTVNAGKVSQCSVRFNYTGYAQSVTDNILTVPDILVAADLLDAALGQYVTITPQIAVAQADGVYSAWQNYQPGIYTGQYFKAQVLLTSSDPTITPLVTVLSFAVDVPDRVERFTNQAVASGGTTLSYPNGAFIGGPAGASVPNVQVTVLGASQGDTVVITGKTLSQVTVQVLNGGVGVARTTDITVQGY